MKRKGMLAVLMAGVMIFGSGCSASSVMDELKELGGSKTEDTASGEVTETPEVTVEATESPAETTEAPEETEAVTEAVTETPEITVVPTVEAEEAGHTLDATELDAFTQWAQKPDNYGLLMSDYTDPHDVNLQEIFYTGAGLPSRSLTDEEKDAYLMSTGGDEIYTDITALSATNINDYLECKLGITLDSVVDSFNWTYLPASDIWVQEHGDTNYTEYICVSGEQKDDGTYVLDFEPKASEYYSKCRTTLKPVDGDYQVLSNKFM